jgi:hypothetical protein
MIRNDNFEVLFNGKFVPIPRIPKTGDFKNLEENIKKQYI